MKEKCDVSCPIPWSSQHGESPMGELETLIMVILKEDMHQVKTLAQENKYTALIMSIKVMLKYLV